MSEPAATASSKMRRGEKYLRQAEEIHKKYPLFDGHNDLPWAIRNGFDMKLSGVDLRVDQSSLTVEGIPWGRLHTDIPRLRKGGVGAQFWSVYVPTTVLEGSRCVQLTLEQIDVVHRLCERYPDTFEMAYTAADVRRIFYREGKIPALCGLEGGHQLGGSLRALRMFHRLGARYLTLTHNGGPGWADAAVHADGSFAREAPCGGLAPFGVRVVREMNRIGMLVDLSHVHERTMHAALECTRAPVIFSHSSTRALCSHPRDVPDGVLTRLRDNGGVVMIVFLSKFVAGEFWVQDGAAGKVGATLLEVADHVDHAVRIAGIDHVGLGGDYDGGSLFAEGLEDVSCYTKLTAELLYRGYNEEQLGKILGLNVLRVLEDCETVSHRLRVDEGELADESHFGEEAYETNIMKYNKMLK